MNLGKKFLLLSVAVFIGSIIYTNSALATTGTVTGDGVRIRKTPSTNSTILTDASKNDKVEVIEKDGNWYKVKFEGYTGYIISDYLEVKEEIDEASNNKTEEENQEAEPENDSEQEPENETEKEPEEEEPVSSVSTTVQEIPIDSEQIINKDTKIHILPVLSSNKIGDLSKDDKVVVIQVLNNWIYVANDDTRGWITLNSIAKNDDTPEQEPENKTEKEPEEPKPEENKTPEEKTEETPINKVGYVNVDKANVREGASTDSEHIITITKNTEVTIIGEEDNWYKIEVKGQTGYIYGKLVSDSKVEETVSRGLETQRKEESKEEEPTKVEENNETIVNNEPEEITTVDTTMNETTTTGSSIVEYAKQFLGYKYVLGGNTPSSGFDCSGFTKYVYKHFGYTLSRTATGQSSNGKKVERNELQKGDLIIFLNEEKSKIGHVGIYIGNNQFIHAANAKRGVVTDSLSSSYYNPRYVSARRII